MPLTDTLEEYYLYLFCIFFIIFLHVLINLVDLVFFFFFNIFFCLVSLHILVSVTKFQYTTNILNIAERKALRKFCTKKKESEILSQLPLPQTL